MICYRCKNKRYRYFKRGIKTKALKPYQNISTSTKSGGLATPVLADYIPVTMFL